MNQTNYILSSHPLTWALWRNKWTEVPNFMGRKESLGGQRFYLHTMRKTWKMEWFCPTVQWKKSMWFLQPMVWHAFRVRTVLHKERWNRFKISGGEGNLDLQRVVLPWPIENKRKTVRGGIWLIYLFISLIIKLDTPVNMAYPKFQHKICTQNSYFLHLPAKNGPHTNLSSASPMLQNYIEKWNSLPHFICIMLASSLTNSTWLHVYKAGPFTKYTRQCISLRRIVKTSTLVVIEHSWHSSLRYLRLIWIIIGGVNIALMGWIVDWSSLYPLPKVYSGGSAHSLFAFSFCHWTQPWVH